MHYEHLQNGLADIEINKVTTKSPCLSVKLSTTTSPTLAKEKKRSIHVEVNARRQVLAYEI